MSVVGFLASLADPASTAAAANKSAAELKRGLRKQLNGNQSQREANGESGEIEKTSEASNDQEQTQPGGESMDLDVHQEITKTTTTTTTTTTTKNTSLASIPLASIGARAAGFASHEEREMTRLVSAATNVTLQKLELKLKYFNEIEGILRAERRELERGRQQLLLDRLAFKRRVAKVMDGLKTAATVGGDQGVRMAQEATQADGDQLGFRPVTGEPSVQAPSSNGQIKSYEA
jgi:SWI/SNF related-matrix-associated actin-dependent regulator of chromatin subfamily C